MAAFVVSPVPMSMGGSVLDYLRYFRDIIVCNQWTDAQSAAIFKSILGVGSHVLDDVPEADLTSFDEIDKVLSQKEAPFREASCSDLMSIYMRFGETMEEFRLADDLKSAMLCTQFTKLDDAVNSTLMAESMREIFKVKNWAVMYKPFTQVDKQDKTVTCFYCKKAGHFKRNCPKLNVGVSRTNRIRQNKPVTCFYCKKAGHFKSNCPKLNVGVSKTAILECDISSRFLLPVQLQHGCVQDFLVDSGGQSSCLPHAHFVSDGDYGRKLRFRSVNGTEIKVTGFKTLNMIINGQRFTHKFPIVNMVGSPILGIDLLKKMRATICFKDGLIKLGNGSTFTLKPENIVKDYFAEASNIVDSRECDEKLDFNGETSDWFIEMAKVDNCYIAQKEDLAPKIEEESSWIFSKNIELAGKPVTEDLEALRNKYEEIFNPKLIQSVGEHTILTTAAPIPQRPYNIPKVYEQQMTQKIKQMLKDGIIQESTSPWCNPLVIVKKKNGNDIRICVDVRKLKISFIKLNFASVLLLGVLISISDQFTVNNNASAINIALNKLTARADAERKLLGTNKVIHHGANFENTAGEYILYYMQAVCENQSCSSSDVQAFSNLPLGLHKAGFDTFSQHCRRQIDCSGISKEYRTYDGTCNNLIRRETSLYGSVGTPLERFLPAAYSD
ncbi:Gag-Pol polyprotein [Nymphon striatum]|nr:Gag-Pol polyprotein [Nymphon striatum]KAG1713930.1 Gag-Pol polyprotein [Nymphon striatum]KAG1713931.1 Gag-Pol polyprotein [Nymphon striatum]